MSEVIATESPPPFKIVTMLPTLLFDVAVPIVIFNLLTHFGVSTLLALVAGGLAPALNNARVFIVSRRLEPLGIIVMAFLAAGTAASLISGSVFFALIKESFLTGTFGLICLVSLFAPRPLMFSITRQFVAGDDPARIAWWNGLWQFPTFRAGMRFITLVWGVAYMVEAFVRVVLALVLSPVAVVAISPIMGFAVLIALIVWSRAYGRTMRERGLRTQHAEQSAAGAV